MCKYILKIIVEVKKEHSNNLESSFYEEQIKAKYQDTFFTETNLKL